MPMIDNINKPAADFKGGGGLFRETGRAPSFAVMAPPACYN